MAEPEIVLLYRIPAVSLESLRVRSVLGEMGIAFKEVRPEDTVRTLGELAAPDALETAIPSSGNVIPVPQDETPSPEDEGPMPGDAAPSSNFPESAMIFCSFTQDRLKLALSRLREVGSDPSCLKAVLTPTNRDWRLCDLLAELIRERDAFVQMRRQGRTHNGAQDPTAPKDSTF